MKEMYPPELHFESSYLPRVRRRPMKQPAKVRIMLPMSIRCNTCGNHISRGTTFNSRKEEVVGETYLGNQRFRFYFQCTECSAELAIKTQPQAPDCVVESGATRVQDSALPSFLVVEDEKRREADDEMGDVMKPLQNS
ncbi:splicing factor YJU2-like [Eucalyptus grandis]|uniref:splicing factor YJU2-like n=1 Tax=Eucalyptus grandis TaxID=71139 RepID=UPI00192EBBE4|nr:splicing factor YJU2-like [Eucalyptus grandis]